MHLLVACQGGNVASRDLSQVIHRCMLLLVFSFHLNLMGCPLSLLFRRGKSTNIDIALAMFARGAEAGTKAQAGGTLLRVNVELDAWAGAGGVTEAVACSVSIFFAA